MDAKRTEYRGIVFRSKSEAQLALLFDLQERNSTSKSFRKWKYEPMQFKTKAGYIPDFIQREIFEEFLADWTVLIEYKPTMPTKTYIKYLEEQFREISKNDPYHFIGSLIIICGNVFKRDFKCALFDRENGHFCEFCDLDEDSWIKPHFYEEVLNYRFDLEPKLDF